MQGKRVVAVALAAVVAAGLPACSWRNSPEQLLADARQYVAKGDFAAALIQLKNAAQQRPDDAALRRELAQVHLRLGDGASAEKELRRAQALRDDPALLPLLGRALLLQNKFKDVLALGKADSRDADLLAVRGEALLAQRKLDEAQQVLSTALQLQPGNNDALYGMARHALAKRDTAGAGHYLDQAIGGNAGDVRSLLLRGDVARLMEKPEAARRDYDKVVALDPGSGAGHLQRAILNIGENKFAAARADLEALHKAAPGNLLYYHVLAQWHFKQNQFPEAREAVLQLLKDVPEHTPSLLLAGAVQTMLGDFPQAEQHLLKYRSQVPQDRVARKLLATVYVESGRPRDGLSVLGPVWRDSQDIGEVRVACRALGDSGDHAAAADCYQQQALKLEPDAFTLHQALGIERMRQGDTKAGLAALRKAAELAPGVPAPHVVLAMTELRTGHPEQARSVMDGLLKRHPERSELHNMSGYLYSAGEQWEPARQAYARAAALKADFFAPVSNLARLDLREGKTDAARARYQQFLAKNPGNVAPLLALADLDLAARQPAAAFKWLEQASAAAPRNLDIALRTLELELELQPAAALLRARKLYTLHASEPRVVKLLGDAQVKNKDAGAALESYAKLVALQPKSAEAWLLQAQAQDLLKQPGPAAESLHAALALEPANRRAVAALIALEMGNGKLQRALEAARRLQQQKQGDAELDGILMEGEILLVAQRPEQAAAAFDKALGKGGGGAVAMRAALAQQRAGRLDEALRRMQKWNAGHPDDAATATYLGELYIADKKYQLAIAEFEQILKKKAGNPILLNNLAWAYYKAGDSRALATAEHAYQAASKDPVVLDTFGWLLVEQGQVPRGLEILKQAATVQPDSTEIRYHLAAALARANQKSAARKELEHLLASNKAFPQADDARKLLQQL
ncbi:XrtA/PEP-CTERM system TPR-repeat protein PrsT [Pseudoduganella sp. OTU4001]|uniref:XrtA/PEP-CTERM system TPR-repeat protein PrsT n=1 Tax=Pseudoduganella sp. OTU4001 TaxID=3043854 RepID=UPI00313E1130